LVSDLYKQAFFYNRYSFSAAYAVVIFLILLGLTAVWFRVSKIADDPGR
jgi:ABC-type sugar transport system permease subunit